MDFVNKDQLPAFVKLLDWLEARPGFRL